MGQAEGLIQIPIWPPSAPCHMSFSSQSILSRSYGASYSTVPLFKASQNKEFTGKSSCTGGTIFLADLHKSVRINPDRVAADPTVCQHFREEVIDDALSKSCWESRQHVFLHTDQSSDTLSLLGFQRLERKACK